MTGLVRPAAAQTLDQVLPPDVAGLATEPEVTVVSRKRPEYDNISVRLGAFTLSPSVSETAGYDTNVLGTTKPSGSPIVLTNAALSLDTDQSRVAGGAALSVSDTRFTSRPSQSHTDWTATIGGGYSLGRDVVAFTYSHQQEAETLQDLGVSQLLTTALPFHVDDARVSYRTEFGRAFVVPAVELSNYAYDNVTANGIFFEQDYRNRLVVQPSVTLGYSLAPQRNLVFVVRDSVASYPITFVGVPARDYNQVTVLGGIDYDVTSVFRVRVLAGYEVRQFQSSAYKPIQAPVIEAAGSYNLTGLTTLTATASRAIIDSSDLTTAGVTETLGKLRVDHELYRNVLLQANAGLTLDEYRSGGNQTLYTLGAGAQYLLNRNARLLATYDFTRRDSMGLNFVNIAGTGATLGTNYNDHRVLLQLQLRL